MTEQQFELFTKYRRARALIESVDPKTVPFIESIYEAAKENTTPRDKCKCADHILRGGIMWLERPTLRNFREVATAIPVEIKHCPECGRKLLPNEKK